MLSQKDIEDGSEWKTAAPLEWNVGTVVLDLYEVKQVHEGGGMGLVYRVHHKDWNLDLAVKCPRTDYFRTETQKENFSRECETWINLGLHPHIVSCYYVRRFSGIPLIFAEYVEGGTLKDWIRNGTLYAGGPEESLKRIMDIAIQFAWGLQYAHERGLIHQDVKPANVLMTPDGRAKVSDFGLAKARVVAGEKYTPGSGKSILVSTGGMTPAYCSPEQANGNVLNHKTDIWSWAVSVLEMFTGEVTWLSGQAADEALTSYLDMMDQDTSLLKIPKDVIQLLESCFCREVGGRPKEMGEVASVLKEGYRQVAGSLFYREDPDAAELLADSLNNQAVSLLDLDKRDDAIAALGRALNFDQHHPESLLNLTQLEATQHRTDPQSAAMRMARVTGTSFVNETNLVKGIVHLCTGTTENAVGFFEEYERLTDSRRLTGSTTVPAKLLMETDPSLVDADIQAADFESDWCMQANAGVLALRRADTQGAVQAYRRACKLRISDALLWADYSIACIECGQIEEGREALKRATALGLQPNRAKLVVQRLAKQCGEALLEMPPIHEADVDSSWNYPPLFARSCQGDGNSMGQMAVLSPDGLTYALACGDAIAIHRIRKIENGYRLSEYKDGFVKLEGHTKYVTSVAFAANGRTLVSGSKDGTIRVWLQEAKAGEWHCAKVIQSKHEEGVRCVAVSPDGSVILSGAEGNSEVKVWSLQTYDRIASLEGLHATIWSLVFSADGGLCAAVDITQTVCVWQVGSWKQVLRGGGRYRSWERPDVHSPLAIAPHGTYLLVRESDPSVMGAIPIVRKGPCSTLRGHQHDVTGVCCLNAEYCATGDTSGEIRIWDVPHGRYVRSLVGGKGRVLSLSWCSKRGLCLAMHEISGVHLWKVDFSELMPTLPRWSPHYFLCHPRSGHEQARIRDEFERRLDTVDRLIGSGKCSEAYQECRSLQALPERQHDLKIIERLGALSGKAKRLKVREAWLLREHDLKGVPVNRVAFSADGTTYAAGLMDGSVVFWDAANGTPRCHFTEGYQPVSMLEFVPNGSVCLIGYGKTGRLVLWDYQQGDSGVKKECELNICSEACLPDGQHILLGYNDGTVSYCSYPSLHRVWSRRVGILPVTSVSVNWATRRCVCADTVGRVVMWDLDGGFVGEIPHVGDASLSDWAHPTLSPDGQLLLVLWALTTDRQVEVWHLTPRKGARGFTGLLKRAIRLLAPVDAARAYKFDSADGNPNCCAFSPDGQFVAFGLRSNVTIVEIRLHDEAPPQPHHLPGHTDYVNSVSFSPGGVYLLSGSMDKTVRLWAVDWDLAFE